MLPGPEKMLKVTGSPELDVPASPTWFVTHCAPGFGNAIACGRRITLKMTGTRSGLLVAPGTAMILVAQCVPSSRPTADTVAVKVWLL